MIEINLLAGIVADADCNAALGSRIYPLVLPDDEKLDVAAATYQLISTNALYDLEEVNELTRIRYQLEVYAKSYLVAKSAVKAVTDYLENLSGDLPDGTRVSSVQLDTQGDLFDDVKRAYCISSDFFVWFNRS